MYLIITSIEDLKVVALLLYFNDMLNDTLGISHYIAPNGRMTAEERKWYKSSWLNSRHT
jgi:hypothetical protein